MRYHRRLRSAAQSRRLQSSIGDRMTASEIQKLISSGLPDARVEVRGDDGQHFEALIVSPSFDGKNTVARHRMVYTALGEKMGGEIHALSMQTLTPEEAGT